MSSRPLTPDELASAYVDDELVDADRAVVEADAALLARVDELRRVREAVAATPLPPVDARQREDALRAALDALDDGDIVVAFAPVARPDRRRPRWALPVLGAAAAALLVALGFAVVNGGGSDDVAGTPPTTVAAAAPTDDSTLAATEEASGDAAGSAALASPTAGASAKAPPPSEADVATLRAVAEAAGGGATATAAVTAGVTCPAPTATAVLTGTATWSTGELVEVFVDRSGVPALAWALTPGTCLVLAVVTLA